MYFILGRSDGLFRSGVLHSSRWNEFHPATLHAFEQKHAFTHRLQGVNRTFAFRPHVAQ